MKKKIIVIASFSFLVIILATCIITWKITANYPWKNLIIKEMEKYINGKLYIESFTFNTEEGRLKNITVSSYEGEELVKIEEIEIKYSLDKYLKTKNPLTCISYVIVKNPTVTAKYLKEGRLDIENLIKKREPAPEKKEPVAFNGEIEITGGTLRITSENPDYPMELNVENLEGKANFWANPKITFSIKAQEDKSFISLKGNSDYLKPQIFGSAKISDIEISRWGKVVPIKNVSITGGKVNVDIDFSLLPWKEEKLLFNGKGVLEVEEGSLTYDDEIKADLHSIKGKILLEKDRVKILGLEGKKGNDTFSVRGKIFNLKEPEFKLFVECREWNLADIEENLVDKVPQIKDYHLKGKATLEAIIDGNIKKPFLMVGLKSPELEVKGEKIKKLTLKGSLMEKNIHIENLKFLWGGGSLSVSGIACNVIDKPSMELNAKIQGFDIEVLRNFIPAIVENNVSGNINCEANLWGSPENPVILASLYSSSGGAKGIYLENINSSVIYHGNTVNITELEANLGGGRINLSGHVLDIKNPAFYFYVEGENVDIDSLKPAAPGLQEIFGQVNVMAEVSGREKDTVARGLIYNSTVSTGKEEVTDLRFAFEYGGAFVTLNNIYAIWKSSPVTGRGIVYTEPVSTIDLFLKSPQIETSALENFYPDIKEFLTGEPIKAEAIVRGFTDNPLIVASAKIPSVNINEYKLKNVELLAYYQKGNLWIPETELNISTLPWYEITDGALENLKGKINIENLESLLNRKLTETEIRERLAALNFRENDIEIILESTAEVVRNNMNIKIMGFLTEKNGTWGAKCSLESKNGICEGINFKELKTLAYISPEEEQIYIDYLDIKEINGAGEFHGKGFIGKDGPELFCTGSGLNLTLAENFVELPAPLSGNMRFDCVLKGHYRNPILEGKVFVDEGDFGDISFSLYSDFEIKDRNLSLSEFSILEKESIYKLKGNMELKRPWKFEFETELAGANISQFEKFFPLLEINQIKGKVSSHIYIKGKLEGIKDLDMAIKDFDINGNVVIYKGKYREFNIEHLNTDFSLEGEKVSFSNLNIEINNTGIEAKGSYNRKTGEISLDFLSQGFNLKDFKNIFNDMSLKGKGQFRGTIEGRPDNLTGWAEFQLLEPVINKYSVDLAEGTLKFDKEKTNRLKIENLNIKKGDDLYGIAGYVDIKSDSELFLTLNAQDVQLKNLLKIANINPGIPVNGSVTTQMHLRGTVSHPVISNNIKIKNLDINSYIINNANAEFYLTEDEIHIGSLEINSEEMSVTGSGYLDKEKDTDLTLEGNNIPLDLLEKALIGKKDIDLEGFLDINLQAKGPTEKLDIISSFQVRDALVNNNKISRIRSLLSYNGEILKIQDLRMVEKDLNIIASGTIPVKWEKRKFVDPAPMDISITTSATDLKIINAFNRDFAGSEGAIESDIHIGGKLFSPEIKGTVKMEDGILIHRLSKESLKNVKLLVNINNESINLEKFEGNLGEGILKADGNLYLNNFKPEKLAINFSGEKLLLDLPDYFRTTVTLSGTIENSIEKPLLRGDILLDNYTAEIYPEILSGNSDKDTYGPYRPGDKIYKIFPALKPAYEFPQNGNTALEEEKNTFAMDLDLNLHAGNGYWVNTTISRMKVSGNLKIVGNTDSPAISGILDIPQGSLRLIGTELEIRHSSLSFDTERGIIPVVFLEGKTILQGREITVTISGPGDNLKTELTSNPPLPQSDVLALLAPDQSQNSFNEQDLLNQIATGLAQGTVTSFVLNPIEETLGKGLGLDVFSINVSPTGNIGLELGKKLTDRLSLSYRLYNRDELDQLNRSTYELERDVLTLEYKINQYTTFDMGTNTSGNFVTRVNVEYRF